MKQSTKVVLSSTVATLFCLGGAAICKKWVLTQGPPSVVVWHS